MDPRRTYRAMSVAFVLGVSTACGSSAPVSPAGVMAKYEGQWSGTTSQGLPINFTVSADQKVTSISVGYAFNGCAGTNTFPDLSLDIGSPPNPSVPNPGPGFGFGSGPPDGPNYTQIAGTFVSGTAANGTLVFSAYSGCGNALGVWTATRK